ncbi:MAG: hypothetical protein WBX38_04640 [Candidatus Sulfotelmatobacter sp.]
MSQSIERIIVQFEGGEIDGAKFHHADHVHLAFAYLCHYPTLQALEKFAAALRRFAAACGRPQLYNETITCAYFFLIRERMTRFASDSWEDFARKNPDLLRWKGGVLGRYYSDATLKSDLARTVFVLPDKSLDQSA